MENNSFFFQKKTAWSGKSGTILKLKIWVIKLISKAYWNREKVILRIEIARPISKKRHETKYEAFYNKYPLSKIQETVEYVE